jgi:altronate dehydratase
VHDALIVDSRDNVATALRRLTPGTVDTNLGQKTVTADVPRGHKFALSDVSDGSLVTKYGETIGRATRAIAAGEHVHVHNVGDVIGQAQGAADRSRAANILKGVTPREPRVGTWDTTALLERTFQGYRRPDGQVGIRNYVLIISTVGCANLVADRIARKSDNPVITHQQGCLQLGVDLELTRRQLIGAARNPNVGAVLLVSLGCEFVQPDLIKSELQGKPVSVVGIQSAGGTAAAISKGLDLVRELTSEISAAVREPFPVSRLVVGTKCGGSDSFSGLTANPATGVAADMLVDGGASVLLSETPGLFGSEPFLVARMKDARAGQRLSAALDRVWDESVRLGEPMSEGEMSPGNIEGGLTTLIEKSLGANTKAGTRRFEGFLELAERVPGPGLWIMDTPGYDILTISAQAAGGAHLNLFTTGRGSPVGCAITPVIKICTNTRTFNHMEGDMDVNAGRILDGDADVEEVGAAIFEMIIATASGYETKSEALGHGEFALARIGSTL